MNEDFRGVLLVVCAHDEVNSLRNTVHALQQACNPELAVRIVIYLAPHATPDCLDQAAQLAAQPFTIPVVTMQEQGGALAKEAQRDFKIQQAQCGASHALFWTADQDAPAELAAQMVEQAALHPAAVIKLSRFLPGGSLPESKRGFINLRDATFRKLVITLYRSKQTDPHFGLSLFPIAPFLRFDLRETFMSFTIEYILCFERMGTQFVELPLHQQDRPEGKSNLKLRHKLRYFWPVLRLRVCRTRNIFKEEQSHD